jgi:hypothetical protein
MKRLIIFLVAGCLCKAGFTQNINFYSETLELAVKYQLGLTENTPLTREIADTVTTLNLSAYGLEDIRDLVYFPNLQRLALSYNQLENVSVLANMQHLANLNLSCNRLRSLDDLAFSESSEMLILTAGNYITDYSLVLNNPNCLFTIIGLNFQKLPFRVNHFYTDFDLSTSNKIVNYNVWAYNEYYALHLLYDGQKESIEANNRDLQVEKNISGNAVYLSIDDQVIDTTHFVLPKTINVTDETMALVPEIPDKYNLLSVESFNSEVSFQNETVYFKIAENISADTVRIGFGETDSNGYNKIKGYTYYYVKSGANRNESIQEHTLLYYPNPVDNRLTVQIPGPEGKKAVIALISFTGQTVYKVETDGTAHQINMAPYVSGIYILYVKTRNKTYTGKVIKK